MLSGTPVRRAVSALLVFGGTLLLVVLPAFGATGPPLPPGAAAPPLPLGSRRSDAATRRRDRAPGEPLRCELCIVSSGCRARRAPLPNGARAPSSHCGAPCTRCHSVTCRAAPRLGSDEDDEDDDHHHGEYCAGCHASGLAFSLGRSPVYVRRGSAVRLIGLLRLAGGARRRDLWAGHIQSGRRRGDAKEQGRAEETQGVDSGGEPQGRLRRRRLGRARGRGLR